MLASQTWVIFLGTPYTLLHNDAAEWSQALRLSLLSQTTLLSPVPPVTKYLPGTVFVCCNIQSFATLRAESTIRSDLGPASSSGFLHLTSGARARKLFEFPPPTSDEVATKNQSRVEF